MTDTSNEQPIKNQVLQSIQAGRVHMRPRWYFILQGALFVIGCVLALSAVLYCVSFTAFTLRETGLLFAPRFGTRGWFVFLRSLPWVLVVFSGVFIIILEILVRRYAFAYRKPLLYSLVGILFVALAGGYIAAPWHRPFYRAARENRLPIGGPLYRHFGMRQLPDIRRGTIVTIFPGGFVIETLRGTTSTVLFGTRTRFPQTIDLEEGDRIVIFGKEKDRVIEAFGVQEILE